MQIVRSAAAHSGGGFIRDAAPDFHFAVPASCAARIGTGISPLQLVAATLFRPKLRAILLNFQLFSEKVADPDDQHNNYII